MLIFRPFRAGRFIAPYQKLRIWLLLFGSFAAENTSFDTLSEVRGYAKTEDHPGY